MGIGLREIMIERLHSSKNGFVSKQNILRNIVRVSKQIKLRTACYGFFVYLKSTYNSVKHSLVLERLREALRKESVNCVEQIYER